MAWDDFSLSYRPGGWRRIANAGGGWWPHRGSPTGVVWVQVDWKMAPGLLITNPSYLRNPSEAGFDF